MSTLQTQEFVYTWLTKIFMKNKKLLQLILKLVWLTVW
jgi:hypothetical protein